MGNRKLLLSTNISSPLVGIFYFEHNYPNLTHNMIFIAHIQSEFACTQWNTVCHHHHHFRFNTFKISISSTSTFAQQSYLLLLGRVTHYALIRNKSFHIFVVVDVAIYNDHAF